MRIGWAACAGLVAAAAAAADTVDLAPSHDNTIYQSPTGALSNGVGIQLFAGKNAVGQIRRALMKFDIAGSIPAGSAITDVKLTLNLSMSQSSDVPVTIHRSLKDWGEGTSDAGDPGGMGALATAGEATWLHTFWDTQFWAGAGGVPGSDYVGAASATAMVGDTLGSCTWVATPLLIADVQSWLDNAAGNFGWFIIGDESANMTAKRFDSRENPTVRNRPLLHIAYTPPPAGCYANCDHSTALPCLNVLDFGCFLNAFAAGQTYANCDSSTNIPVLNVLDFGCFLNAFAAGCSNC